MIQLLLHLLGDYFLQNDWMATNKRKWTLEGWVACVIHCLLYAIPFGIYYNPTVCLLVYSTHILVDKFCLAKYFTMLINWNWEDENFGFNEMIPAYLTTWLHIIMDNSLHIACNYFIILYFTK